MSENMLEMVREMEGMQWQLIECSMVHEHQGDSLGREETEDGD